MAGFVLGQGALFLAQSWLVGQGQLQLLALFGSHFNFAMLALFLVDAGSIATLSRVVADPRASLDEKALAARFWATSLVRSSIAIVVSVVAIGLALFFGGEFSLQYVCMAIPALFLRAFDVVGILDGMRRSGVTGVSTSVVYITSALAVFAAAAAPQLGGAIVGAAFTLGAVMGVITTHSAARRYGVKLPFLRPDDALIKRVLKDSLAMLANSLPGQVFYRIQILLAGAILGVEAVGLFIYAKQIINAISQLVVVVRRVEFPVLVKALAQDSSRPAYTTFWTLKVGLILAGGGAVGLLLLILAAGRFLPEEFQKAAEILLYLLPVLLTGSINLTVSEGLYAMGNYSGATKAIHAGLLVGVALTATLPFFIGVLGLVVAEVSMHMIATSVQLRAYQSPYKRS